jgi:hypothetical protein
MSSKKEGTDSAEKPRRRAPQRSTHTAAQKVQAVLAVWTDRIKPVAVMRSMGISYMQLQQWQERAMEGMLQALESRANLEDGAALSPRLRTLLQKRQSAAACQEKLTTRLTRLQKVAPEPKPESTG